MPEGKQDIIPPGPQFRSQGARAIIRGEEVDCETAEEKLGRLVDAWRQEVMMISNQVTILMHPAHYAIIGMGHEALPFIFKDLANGGGPWFVALGAITQENPVSEQNSKDARGIREDWLAWGKTHDYLGSR